MDKYEELETAEQRNNTQGSLSSSYCVEFLHLIMSYTVSQPFLVFVSVSHYTELAVMLTYGKMCL